MRLCRDCFLGFSESSSTQICVFMLLCSYDNVDVCHTCLCVGLLAFRKHWDLRTALVEQQNNHCDFYGKIYLWKTQYYRALTISRGMQLGLRAALLSQNDTAPQRPPSIHFQITFLGANDMTPPCDASSLINCCDASILINCNSELFERHIEWILCSIK